MLLTICGLIVTTVISLLGVLSGGHGNALKAALIILTVTGFGVSIVAASGESASRKDAETKAQKLTNQLSTANTKIDELRAELKRIDTSVGDLSVLDMASDNTKYFVRIAADTSSKDLKKYMNNLAADYPGLMKKGMICVREPKAHSNEYKLVFGQGLNLAAAEVFHRLATSHQLPPKGSIAYLIREDGSDCVQ